MIEYYYLATFLFGMGLLGSLIKQDVISMLMSIQMMFMSIGLFFLLFSKNTGNLIGQVETFFITITSFIMLAVGIGLVMTLFSKNKTIYFEDMDDQE